MRNTLSFVVLSFAGATTQAQPTPAQPAPAQPAPAQPAPVADPNPTASMSTSVSPTATPEPAKVWRFAVEPRLGFIVPTAKLGPMVIGGIELDVPVAMDHRLLIGLDLSLTRPSHDGSVMDPRLSAPAEYTIKETELVIALLVSYRLASHDHPLVPWVGVGPMAHLLRSTESTTIAPGDNTAVSTEIGLELAGGIDYRIGPGFIVGDLRIVYSKLDHEITGNTNAGKISLAAGYRLMF